MPNLSLKLRNCYGIQNLEYSLDLGKHDGRGGSFSIYAPNGVMKSSLARTFDDYANERVSRDLIFQSRETRREIKWDEEDLDPKSVFVVKPYVESYESEAASTLIANPNLQKEYTDSMKELVSVRKKLVTELKKLSSITSRTETPDQILAADLEASENDLTEKIEELLKSEFDVAHLDGVRYAEIFNPKTLAVLEKADFQSQLAEYVGLYNTLVEESPVLCRTFNHQGATTVSKGLKESGFYTAGHTVNLKVADSSKTINSPEELEETFKLERERILSDSSLRKRFDAVDKSLGNADTRKLRAAIEINEELLGELSDLNQLRKKLWYSYLQICRDELEEFLKVAKEVKEILARLIASAQEEETKWLEVIRIFNRRFDVPFRVSVENQADVILKGEKPAKSFSFEDSSDVSGVAEKTLLSVLSQGERRALYILNLLFEIETRKESDGHTLFVIDDIADSFDYRNKYAIIEYLRELSKHEKFTFLFLTHNFDFHRTVASRLGLQRNKRLVASRVADGIDLRIEKYQKDVFAFWRDNMGSNERMFLACIPFVRNLAEYCGRDDVFLSLTKAIHLKQGSDSRTYGDLAADYSKILSGIPTLQFNDNELVLNRIQFVAEEIATSGEDHIELEEKIILAISIRLIAEDYMLRRLDDPDWEEPSSNQTRELFDQFSANFGSEADVIAILDQVNLMTPENIHINSFMFEPILDMSSGHLYRLFDDIKELREDLD